MNDPRYRDWWDKDCDWPKDLKDTMHNEFLAGYEHGLKLEPIPEARSNDQ